MTQNFTVVEQQTEKKGVYVPVAQTVADVRAILDGKVDILRPEDLLYIGTLKEVEQLVKDKSTKVSTAITKELGTEPAPQSAPPAQPSTASTEQTQPKPN